MSKIVQILGHLKNLADKYVGAEREVTVDTSNWDLRIHDGSTAGGRVIQTRQNADARYQPKSAELAGFATLEPQQRGLMVRLGPADYRLRQIQVNADQLTVQYGNGFDGNPTLGLAEEIKTEHLWSGQQVFDELVQFNAGINANVSGDTFGTHTGPSVGNLTGNANGDHVGSFAGDVDVRGKQLLLDSSQIPVVAIAGLTEAIVANAVPSGVIMLWSGSINNIPAGWFLCDGDNGTPDLTDKFIIGAGLAYAVADVGGGMSHTHGVTIEADGAHTHNLTSLATSSSQTGASVARATTQVENEQQQVTVATTVTLNDPGHAHTVSGATDTGGSHSHAASTGAADHLPPYYALAYIMRA